MTTPPTTPCCAEYAGLSRRGLLRGALVAGAATTFGSAVLSTSPAAAAPARAVLLMLSLRGASDGLSLVVPHGDPVYYQARPRIAVPADTPGRQGRLLRPAPGDGAAAAPVDARARSRPSTRPGLPVRNRSHFSAMEQLEDANPGSTKREGWLNRLIGVDAITSPVQALSLAEGVPPAALYGPAAVPDRGRHRRRRIAGDDPNDPTHARRRSLRTLWAGDRTALGGSMRSTFEAVDTIAPLRDVSKTPQNGATYPVLRPGPGARRGRPHRPR